MTRTVTRPVNRIGQAFGAAGRCLDASLATWMRVPRPWRWVAPIALMGLLWWSSSQTPAPREPSVLRSLLHNGMHVVAFGALAAATWLASLPRSPHLGARSAAARAVLLAVAYGVVDEVHQGYVPGRTSSPADVLSDACGALLAVCLLRARYWAPPRPLGLVIALLFASAGSVALATFGPW